MTSPPSRHWWQPCPSVGSAESRGRSALGSWRSCCAGTLLWKWPKWQLKIIQIHLPVVRCMWLFDMFSTWSSGIEARISSTLRDSLNGPTFKFKFKNIDWVTVFEHKEHKMDINILSHLQCRFCIYLWILEEVVWEVEHRERFAVGKLSHIVPRLQSVAANYLRITFFIFCPFSHLAMLSVWRLGSWASWQRRVM